MPQNFNLDSLNLKVSPLAVDASVIRCHNVERDMIGAWKKRPGYTAYLGTANGSAIDNLFNFTLNDGTTFYNYRASGGIVYYSTQGTGAWTIAGNGTMTAGTPVYNGVALTTGSNTLMIGDGAAATRHSTNGTSFTNTTNAPIARGFMEYQQRMYAIGTAQSMFWSNVGTATDWTNDSSSVEVPGPGRLHTLMKINDRLVPTKNYGNMYRWDGFNMVDLATNLGPTSPLSIGTTEEFAFWLNRLGIFGYGGNKPEIVSNPIERIIYNDAAEGIAGTTFDNAPGIVHRYDYFLSVGTVTDDLTDETIPNAIIGYDFQLNEWRTYSFADRPTAWLSYRDASGDQQLIFGAGSQCFTYGGTITTDNGATIESVIEFVIHGGRPAKDKEWKYLTLTFNPGCQAKVQIAAANTFTRPKKNWVDLGVAVDGVVEYKPSELRSKLLFVKIYEASRNARFHFYGFSYEADAVERR